MQNLVLPPDLDKSLRPKTFDQYIGQKKVLDRMKVYVQAALNRLESLDHVLLFGPPGLGKTTLANVISREMNVTLHTTSGPVIEKPGDLAALLTQLNDGDVLFIDEIHRLSPSIEEILYPAMEDFQLDLMVGEGPGARSMRLDLNKFCLIGATTKPGMLTAPLRDRFGIQARLEFYDYNELALILEQSAKKLNLFLSQEAFLVIAQRARGTPRIALRLLKRIRDFIEVGGLINPTSAQMSSCLQELEIDDHGLDHFDRTLLKCILERYDGGPVGLDALATAVGEGRETLEDVIEPYLVQENFLQRTPRGRKLTPKAIEHLHSYYNQ
ncbi:Holliday junction branch migration DNA helicase RuvB [bacterium]|jgi:Holliday junction DNA helicase RuvB|nr:Holliday junction branch migration DNA helicase RuvB [bacterium]NBX72550.1 Holliday junction branch migration DNA helicase RuvB [bacterium]